VTPTVGRIVHMTSRGSADGQFPPATRAAIITEVLPAGNAGGPRVNLCVLNPTGLFFDLSVPYAEEPTPGHWSWPPRV
jgi:hypothetical protein